MRSLRFRFLLVLIPAILFNSGVILLTAWWGAMNSRDEWRETVTAESIRRLAEEVEILYTIHGSLTPSNSRVAMDRITHFTDELATFAVYNADKVPVYYWRNQAYSGLSPDYSLKPQYAVMHRDQIIGWVSCLPSDFYFIRANRTIVLEIIRTLILGLMVSIAAAVALSLRMSNRLTRDARKMAVHLERLSRGDREVSIPDQNTTEFQTIARASSRLRDTLIKEESQRLQWTQDIAHDLKTPVTALQGQLEGVRDGVFQLTEERYAVLEREFGQIDKLVRDLSLLSRVESPQMIPVIRKIDSNSFLDQIKGSFTDVARKAGMELICRNAGEDLIFLADPDLLTRGVNNMIQNAIQHTRNPGKRSRITVEIAAEGDGVALSVENPGRIPDTDLPNLFQRLYRGDTGRSTPGSGLGLTIVRAVAEKLGGSVTARNTSRGTVRIRLILPRRGA